MTFVTISYKQEDKQKENIRRYLISHYLRVNSTKFVET